MDAQRVRHTQQMGQLHLVTSLHALDRRPVDARTVGEALLSVVHAVPPDANAVADGLAGIGDPLGVVGGGHPHNALSIMIISQQQNCRFL